MTLGEVKSRVLSVLDDEFEKTKSIRGHIDDPKPSEDQVLKALEELAQEGKAERDPPFSEGKRQGATVTSGDGLRISLPIVLLIGRKLS